VQRLRTLLVNGKQAGALILTVLCQSVVNFTSQQMSKRQPLFSEHFCYKEWTASCHRGMRPLKRYVGERAFGRHGTKMAEIRF